MVSPPADTVSASALLWTWIAGNIGPIATIILTVTAMARYLEKRNVEKIECAKREILTNVDSKLDNIVRDITSMNATYDLIRKYIESDIKELKAELMTIKSKDMGSGSGSGSGSMDFRSRLQIERERLAKQDYDVEREEVDKVIEERKKKWERRGGGDDHTSKEDSKNIEHHNVDN